MKTITFQIKAKTETECHNTCPHLCKRTYVENLYFCDLFQEYLKTNERCQKCKGVELNDCTREGKYE